MVDLAGVREKDHLGVGVGTGREEPSHPLVNQSAPATRPRTRSAPAGRPVDLPAAKGGGMDPGDLTHPSESDKITGRKVFQGKG